MVSTIQRSERLEKCCYLSPVIDKDELDAVVVRLHDLHDLCRNPSLFLVGEPYSSALAVYIVRHGGKGRRG